MPSNIFVGNAHLSPVRSAFRRIFFLPPFPRPHPKRQPIKYIYLHILIYIYKDNNTAVYSCSIPKTTDYRRPFGLHVHEILNVTDLGGATTSEHPSSPLAARLPQQQPTTCDAAPPLLQPPPRVLRFPLSSAL